MPEMGPKPVSPCRELADIADKAAAYLGFLSELGYSGLDLSEPSLLAIASWGTRPHSGRKRPGRLNHPLSCRQCQLAELHQPMIPGYGRPDPRLMIVGGMPEPEDARTGKPYSGRAGALLDKILAAMHLERGDVYLTLAIKCRFPKDQKVNISVVNACGTHLKKELTRVRPQVICSFGEIAAMSLLETATPLAQLRGRFHDYSGVPLMLTHGPEYLLENAAAKREAWEDIKQVMARLSLGNRPAGNRGEKGTNPAG